MEDLGSRNTTLLNGRPVATRAQIGEGDVIRVSDSEIVVQGFRELLDEDRSRPDSGLHDAKTMIVPPDPAKLVTGTPGRHTERLKLLNEVHRALAASISLDELLELILDRAFAHLKPEEAVIFLKNENGFERAASRRLPHVLGDHLYSRRLIEEVTEKKVAALVKDAQIDERFAGAQSIVDAGVRSLVAAPLLHPGGCPGMIVLASRVAVRQFSEEDMELLVTLASVAAVRIHNIALNEEAARRRELEVELEMARRIQVALLPTAIPEVEGYSLLATNLPSKTVSGDLYRIHLRGEGEAECVLFLADVSGKGMAASLLTASIEALSAGPIEVGRPPDDVCDKLSRRLYARTPPEKYATAMLAVLDRSSGTVSYTNGTPYDDDRTLVLLQRNK